MDAAWSHRRTYQQRRDYGAKNNPDYGARVSRWCSPHQPRRRSRVRSPEALAYDRPRIRQDGQPRIDARSFGNNRSLCILATEGCAPDADPPHCRGLGPTGESCQLRQRRLGQAPRQNRRLEQAPKRRVLDRPKARLAINGPRCETTRARSQCRRNNTPQLLSGDRAGDAALRESSGWTGSRNLRCVKPGLQPREA